MRWATASVGTIAAPAAAIAVAVSSSSQLPCSKHVTPAANPLRMPRQLWAWAVTYVPRASASSTATRSSSIDSWVSSRSSLRETTPPLTKTLSWVAPRRNAVRAALRTSSGLSHTAVASTRPGSDTGQ